MQVPILIYYYDPVSHLKKGVRDDNGDAAGRTHHYLRESDAVWFSRFGQSQA